MPFLYDEAFDYNDVIAQQRALVRDFPQKTKTTPENPTADGNGFVLDNTVSGPAVGAGFMYEAALNTSAGMGTLVATCVVGGTNVAQVGVGTEVTGLTTVDLNETGNYIEDNNGGSSTDFSAAGFVATQVVKVNGAGSTNSLKWNGYYRIVSITSANGGTNNRLNLTAADIVGTPGDFNTQSGIVLTPIGAGAYFSLTGTAGVTGLLVAGQRFVRDAYSVIIRRTTADFSAAGNADRFTMTMGDGGATAKHLLAPSTVDFDTTADTIVDDDGNDLEVLGFRVGGGVFVRNATVGANDGLKTITAIDTSVSPNDRLTVAENLTTSANDATAELLPMNATPVLALVVDFVVAGSEVRRNDLQAWTADGIFPGDYCIIANAATGGNNGPVLVLDVITTTQRNDTLVLAKALAADTADAITITGYFVPERFGDQHFAWDQTDSQTALRDAGQVTGEEPPREDGDGNFGTQWNFEASGRSFGQGVADRIFGGLLSEFDNAGGRFNLTVAGADGFVASSTFSSQPNSPEVFTMLEANAFPYAVSFNGEHLRGFARVSGSIDEPWYIGFGELQAGKGQHPYPMLVGGAAPVGTFIPSTVDVSHRAWWDPAANGAPAPTSCTFQQVDGTYKGVQHSTSTSYNPSALKEQWFTPFVNQAAESDAQADNNWQSKSLRLRRTLSDEYQLLPLELFNNNPDAPYIKPYGVTFISGEANAGLNTTVVNGVTHVITQNINLSGNNNFTAFALD